METETQKELVEFLQTSARPDVKKAALTCLLDMTGNEEGCEYIMERGSLLEALLKTILCPDASIREVSEKCLLNLTADERVVSVLLDHKLLFKDVVLQLLLGCLSPKNTGDVLFCILTNMTRVPDCSVFVASIMQETESVSLKHFVRVMCSMYANKKDIGCISMLLMNLTQVPAVRQKLMKPPDYLLKQLLPLLSFSSSLTSVKGIIGAVKNCCFEYEFHGWLLSEEINVLPRILLPLAGPEEFDDDDMERLPVDLQFLPDSKQREADPGIRNMLVQAVHKLCSTKSGRLHLKEKNTYIILRELHKWETCVENVDEIMKVIDILIGDEPEPGMEDLHAVKIPPHLEEQFLKDDQAS